MPCIGLSCFLIPNRPLDMMTLSVIDINDYTAFNPQTKRDFIEQHKFPLIKTNWQQKLIQCNVVHMLHIMVTCSMSLEARL